MRFDWYPISFAMDGLPSDGPRWGAEYKRMVREYYTRSAYALAHTTQLPQESSTITLDPDLEDAWGLPAIRTTFTEHPNDRSCTSSSSIEIRAVGSGGREEDVAVDAPWQVHLLGTCRMGNDPRKSVIDKFHRAHDVPNLFIVDGSSFVTCGTGQPTMTIQALAFRAADAFTDFAKRGEISKPG